MIMLTFSDCVRSRSRTPLAGASGTAGSNDRRSLNWLLPPARMMALLGPERKLVNLLQFAWGGAAGTYFFVDTQNALACVIVTQLLGYHIGAPTLRPEMARAAYEYWRHAPR